MLHWGVASMVTVAVMGVGVIILELWVTNLKLKSELRREQHRSEHALLWAAAQQAREKGWSEEQFFEVCLACFHASKVSSLEES